MERPHIIMERPHIIMERPHIIMERPHIIMLHHATSTRHACTVRPSPHDSFHVVHFCILLPCHSVL